MASRSKKPRKFLEDWLTEFKWLVNDPNDGMKCSLCLKHGRKNVFTSGCTDYQHSSLVRHQKGTHHQLAISASKAFQAFKTGVARVQTTANEGLKPQMKTVAFICIEGLALSKFNALMELQTENGLKIPGLYHHHEAVGDMVTSLSKTLKDELSSKILQSQFIGLITDESCDIAVFKKLVVYIKLIVAGKTEIMYVKNMDVPDGCAGTITDALCGFIEEAGIPQAKVIGFGSDGAAVMTGIRTGVGE